MTPFIFAFSIALATPEGDWAIQTFEYQSMIECQVEENTFVITSLTYGEMPQIIHCNKQNG